MIPRRQFRAFTRRLPGMAVVIGAALLTLGVLGAGAPGGSSASAATRAKWDTRVLAQVPSPGFPALSLVAPDRRIYVGSFENPAGDNLPSKVFRYGPDGALETSFTISGQDLSTPHGIQVAAQDAQGQLYLMQQSPARVLRFDPKTGASQVYASFRQLPTCVTAPAGGECKQASADNAPEPDYGAWGPDGSLYVTDYQQALIWRVPPGGGTAHVWFTDPRLDGAQFDAAGIVLMPDHRTLLFDTAASSPSTGPDFADGKLYQLPIGPDGRPGTLRQLWRSGPREAPDGFALASSGNIYVALVGPGANQLVEVSPQGTELGRYPPDPATNNSLTVPYDEPSSVQFDGQRMIVTNLAYLDGNSAHQVLFDVWAGEAGAPIYRPPASSTQSGARRGAMPRLRLLVTPRHLRARTPTRLRVTVTARAGRRSRRVPGASVTASGHRVRTDRSGRAFLALRPRHPGHVAVMASKPGYRSARVRLSVRRARHRGLARARRPRDRDG